VNNAKTYTMEKSTYHKIRLYCW